MKSLKMILSAAAVFAVVGASLAFTPKTFSTFCLYEKASADAETCPFVDVVETSGTDQIAPFGLLVNNPGECNEAALPGTQCTETNIAYRIQ